MWSADNSKLLLSILVFVTDINEKQDEEDVLEKLKKTTAKVLVVINKIDESNNDLIEEKISYWKEKLNPEGIIGCSALHSYNLEPVMSFITENLPEHPAYYEKDELTDSFTSAFIFLPSSFKSGYSNSLRCSAYPSATLRASSRMRRKKP